MIELGELEAKHEAFEKRKTRVIVVSVEGREAAAATQAEFPHLVVVADADRGLTEAVEVLHPRSAPDGGDTSAPTTFLVDSDGVVRWTFRAERFLVRLSPDQVLAAVDELLPGR